MKQNLDISLKDVLFIAFGFSANEQEFEISTNKISFQSENQSRNNINYDVFDYGDRESASQDY